jgi:hypothetical protein
VSSFLSFCAERQIIEFNPLLGKAINAPQAKVRERGAMHAISAAGASE